MVKHETCIICLTDCGDISTKHTYLACKCNVPVHTDCWMQYVRTKNGLLECPMCHVITLRNPILPASITGMAKEVPVPREKTREELDKERDECVGRCICGCLIWCVASITIGTLLG